MPKRSVKPVPAIHSSDCACPKCVRAQVPTGGGRAPDALPRLSDDGLSRFKLHDAAHEASGKLGFVSLNDRFCDYLDQRRERALEACQTLCEREPEAALCLRLSLLEQASQRALATQTGLSLSTVNRRLRLAREFLLAAVGEQTAPELRGLVKHHGDAVPALGA